MNLPHLALEFLGKTNPFHSQLIDPRNMCVQMNLKIVTQLNRVRALFIVIALLIQRNLKKKYM
jgi:hypothetical protein